MRTASSSSFVALVVLAAQTLGLAGCSMETSPDSEAQGTGITSGPGDVVPSAMAAEPKIQLPPATQGSMAAQPKLVPVVVPLGQPCTSGDQCGSGFCTDGVCCETACNGTCESCAVPTALGFCLPHDAGTDPENECGAPACMEGQQESFSCDGAGTCQVEIVSCGAAGCGETACLDSGE